MTPPMPDHAELRKRKGDEYVNAVENDEKIDRAARGQEDNCRGGTHQEDSILRDEPIAQRCEAGWKPAVERHVGEHARAIEKTGLGSDEKEGGSGNHGD